MNKDKDINCEILASAMNQRDEEKLIRIFGIKANQKCTIINQLTKKGISVKSNITSGPHRFYSFKEKGLSRSRNHALDCARGDICIICDDDCHFTNGYEQIVVDAYKEHPDVDMITFDFRYDDHRKRLKTMSEGKVGFIRAMRVSSTQISFRLQSIKDKGIRFDDEFGTGSGKYNFGEENIFLADCLKAGLKIYHIPIVVITVKSDFGTTWDRSSTPEYFKQQGAIYYRMSSKYWRILALQYALRKRKIYGKTMNGFDVFRFMVRGAKDYKKEHGFNA